MFNSPPMELRLRELAASAGRLSGSFGLQLQGMQTGGQLVFEQFVDEAVPRHGQLASKAVRHHVHSARQCQAMHLPM